jgi:hypothetical protein
MSQRNNSLSVSVTLIIGGNIKKHSQGPNEESGLLDGLGRDKFLKLSERREG